MWGRVQLTKLTRSCFGCGKNGQNARSDTDSKKKSEENGQDQTRRRKWTAAKEVSASLDSRVDVMSARKVVKALLHGRQKKPSLTSVSLNFLFDREKANIGF